jgi:hypothetical protein
VIDGGPLKAGSEYFKRAEEAFTKALALNVTAARKQIAYAGRRASAAVARELGRRGRGRRPGADRVQADRPDELHHVRQRGSAEPDVLELRGDVPVVHDPVHLLRPVLHGHRRSAHAVADVRQVRVSAPSRCRASRPSRGGRPDRCRARSSSSSRPRILRTSSQTVARCG